MCAHHAFHPCRLAPVSVGLVAKHSPACGARAAGAAGSVGAAAGTAGATAGGGVMALPGISAEIRAKRS